MVLLHFLKVNFVQKMLLSILSILPKEAQKKESQKKESQKKESQKKESQKEMKEEEVTRRNNRQ